MKVLKHLSRIFMKAELLIERLRNFDKILDDFDLLIGAAAVTQGMTLVTNNTEHFRRLSGIELENWIL